MIVRRSTNGLDRYPDMAVGDNGATKVEGFGRTARHCAEKYRKGCEAGGAGDGENFARPYW
jgi:hypothetical protein